MFIYARIAIPFGKSMKMCKDKENFNYKNFIFYLKEN